MIGEYRFSFCGQRIFTFLPPLFRAMQCGGAEISGSLQLQLSSLRRGGGNQLL
jgi:hypothetical protein